MARAAEHSISRNSLSLTLGRRSTLPRYTHRHQTGNGWRQGTATSDEAMTPAPRSTDDDGDLPSQFSALRSSPGGADRADPLFHPSNENGAQVYRTSGWEKRSANLGIGRIRNGSIDTPENLSMRPCPSTTRHGDPLPSGGSMTAIMAPMHRAVAALESPEAERAPALPRARLERVYACPSRRHCVIPQSNGDFDIPPLPRARRKTTAPSDVHAEGVRLLHTNGANSKLLRCLIRHRAGNSSSAVSPCRTTGRLGRPMTWACCSNAPLRARRE